MAKKFDGDPDYVSYSNSANIFGGLTAMSMSTWINVTSFANPDRFIEKWVTGDFTYIWYTLGSGSFEFIMGEDSTVRNTCTASSSQGTGLMHVVSTWASGDNLRYYKNGSLVQTGTQSPTWTMSSSDTRLLTIGGDSNGTASPVCEFAETAFYGIQLSSQEIQSLADGFAPPAVRRDALIFYDPHLAKGDNSRDLINGWSGTQNGDVADVDHPPIIYPRSARIYILPAAAGSGVTVDVPAATLSYTCQVPSVATGVEVAVPAATLAYACQTPSVATGVEVAVPAATLAYACQTPSVSAGAGAAISVPAATLSYTCQVPSVATGVEVAVPAATLAYACQTPSVATGVEVAVPAATLAYACRVPSVATGATTVNVPAATLTYALYVPGLAIGTARIDDWGTFFDTRDFAVPVVHQSRTWLAIFDDYSIDQGGPRVRLDKQDIETFSRGDTLEVDARTFEVRGFQHDGHGTVSVVLWEVT